MIDLKRKIFILLKKRPKLMLAIILASLIIYTGFIFTKFVYIPLSLPPEDTESKIIIKENLFQQVIKQLEDYEKNKSQVMTKTFPDPFR